MKRLALIALFLALLPQHAQAVTTCVRFPAVNGPVARMGIGPGAVVEHTFRPGTLAWVVCWQDRTITPAQRGAVDLLVYEEVAAETQQAARTLMPLWPR